MSDNDQDIVDEEVASSRAHPRFRERRAEVADQSLRSRNRKLIAGGVLALLVMLAAAATQSALLDVDEVRVVGAELLEPEFLRAEAGVELGSPILGFDTGEVEERLLALPRVRTATATTSWRGVLTIEVNERLPVAWIDSDAGLIVVAGDGTVLDVVQPAEDGLVPPEIAALTRISGAIFSTEAGNQVPEVLTDALAVAERLPSDVSPITERVEITVDSLVLRTVGGGSISLGDARDLDAKFDAVRAFLAEVDLSCMESLNVGAPTVPVIVRKSSC